MSEATIEPHQTGMLDVGDGNRVYWEVCGNPKGKPALVVHGGPGSGCRPSARQHFDPELYRVVLFDQRGCGRSTPSAADPATDLRHNTTHHLIADMEQLRRHLGIDSWLLCGGSWGSTLILAYAERYPERVSEIVIQAVTMTRRSELDWLYHGASSFFPEAWERFRAGSGLGADRTAEPLDVLELLSAYARSTSDPDRSVRERATADWCAWEDAVLSHESGGAAPYGDRPSTARLELVRICAHYFSRAAWLEEGELLREAKALRGIPGVLVQGRLDFGGPPRTAWQLSRAWPDAELQIVESAGHLATGAARGHFRAALDRFARRTG